MKLPTDGEWPENKPKLDPDGQYRLPLNVQRTRKPAAPAHEQQPPPQKPTRKPRPRQQSLPLNLPGQSRPRTRQQGDQQ